MRSSDCDSLLVLLPAGGFKVIVRLDKMPLCVVFLKCFCYVPTIDSSFPNGLSKVSNQNANSKRSLLIRFLDGVEWLGNKLPDPVVLFVIGIGVVWVLSFGMSNLEFSELDPRETKKDVPIAVKNMMNLTELANLLSKMVFTYVNFAPLGVVLVALLGVGVAEHAGFINAVLKSLLDFTPRFLLTPMVIFVAVISHTAADAGYVLVIPLAALMFHAAGRHPLTGIAAAFAGVSGGFSANFIPSGIDPLLSGIAEVGANIYDPSVRVNPLCNWYFTAASSFLVIGLGWLITDLLIEPKLRNSEIDKDADIQKIESLSDKDRFAMYCGLATMAIGIVLLIAWAAPQKSSLRDPQGSLTSNSNSESNLGFEGQLVDQGLAIDTVIPTGAAEKSKLEPGDVIVSVNEKPVGQFLNGRRFVRAFEPGVTYLIEFQRGGETKYAIYTPGIIPGAPLMSSIVPLIFLLFIIPGIVHGYVSGKFANHRDVIKGMSKSMESMAYYLVLVFFVALFIYVFVNSNIGLLLAVKGANLFKNQPPAVIIIGVILITAVVNLLVGSASAKWAMLAPIFIPMLMILGISPEFTQAAYRVGDSTTNIITPMMPYFPLVVVFGQKYVKSTGIGTITSLMLPYSICFLVCWTIFLLVYWQIGFPLGLEGGYEYVKPN
jgi:p-aminobenzoyl-glutamate transporter AbgT